MTRAAFLAGCVLLRVERHPNSRHVAAARRALSLGARPVERRAHVWRRPTRFAGARERYAQCSEALGLAGDLPEALARSGVLWACRRSAAALLERGVDERMFRDAVPGMARDALASGSPANNPLVPSEADVAALPRVVTITI